MSRVLVTGAQGQLGREIMKLRSFFPQVYTFTDIDELDLSDASAIEQFMSSGSFRYLVNCAAFTNVDGAEKEPEQAMKINRDSVGNILQALERHPECRLIHVSTDYVFSGESVRPLREEDPTDPQSVYGRTKLAGEKLLEDNPNAMVIRTAWLYSVFGKNFVKSMINRMDAHTELRVVYDQVGSPTYAEDLARAIMQIISKVEDGSRDFVPEVFHYSNEGVCSWYDLTIEICRQINCKVNIEPILSEEFVLPASRPAYSVFNKHKIKKTYGLEIPHWRDSLQKCIKNLL